MKMRTWSIILLFVVTLTAGACGGQPAEEDMAVPEPGTEAVEPNAPDAPIVDTTAVDTMDTMMNDTTGM